MREIFYTILLPAFCIFWGYCLGYVIGKRRGELNILDIWETSKTTELDVVNCLIDKVETLEEKKKRLLELEKEELNK